MNISLPAYRKGNSCLFALGRNAMYSVCKILDIQKGDEILTPAFDCDGALHPFRVLGCKIRFFKSDPYDFSANIEDIRSKVTSKTKLIHIINHFGFAQPWEDLLALRKEVDIPILEDNAYSLFSKSKNEFFGSFGDFSIFSLRKNLLMVDGGMLLINNSKFSFKPMKKSSRKFFSVKIFSILKMIKAKSGIYKTPRFLKYFLKKLNPEIEPLPSLYSDPGKGFPQWPLRDKIGSDFSCDYLRPISNISTRQLSEYSKDDFTDIVNKKRQYYLWLSKKIAEIKGISILWPDLPEGIAPFCLSVLIESNRDEFLGVLRNKYDVMVWPTLSSLVLNQLKNFPEVEILGRKLLQINLPADKVRLPSFSLYLEDLVGDMQDLAKKYL